MTRSGAIAAVMLPSGSRLASRVPFSGPAMRWKYHQGRPFCAETTAVSGPSSGESSGATSGTPWALTVRKTKSTGPIAS